LVHGACAGVEVGIGGIVSFNRDGGDRKVVLTGLRNSSGLAFNPKDKSLWWTDNQVDGMGDETPPGELNKVPVGADGKLTHGLWYGTPTMAVAMCVPTTTKRSKSPKSWLTNTSNRKWRRLPTPLIWA
jgi:hypothetical protein